MLIWIMKTPNALCRVVLSWNACMHANSCTVYFVLPDFHYIIIHRSYSSPFEWPQVKFLFQFLKRKKHSFIIQHKSGWKLKSRELDFSYTLSMDKGIFIPFQMTCFSKHTREWFLVFMKFPLFARRMSKFVGSLRDRVCPDENIVSNDGKPGIS